MLVRRWVLMIVIISVAIPGCGARPAAVPDEPECTISGVGLSSIEPPRDICFPPGDMPRALEDGLRRWGTNDPEQAIALLEPLVIAGPGDQPAWWRAARYFLARSYDRVGRTEDARHYYRLAAMSPEDPFRWTAAGFYCGVHRTIGSIGRWPRCAPPSSSSVP